MAALTIALVGRGGVGARAFEGPEVRWRGEEASCRHARAARRGSPARRAGTDVEVMIPHWNRAESLRRTLEALRAQTVAAEITVVDNGSDDGTEEMLRQEFDEVRCLWLGSNLGFGAAVNRGVEASDARLVVLLNNDTVADPAFVERLAAAQAESGAEMVAGCLRRPDGAIESLGVEVDESLITYDVWHGEPYERLGREAPPEPLAPSGGAAAFLRNSFLAEGGFDEEIFAYLEDVELGIRMRLAGMRCASAPDAFAWHQHSATLGSGAEAKNRLMGASRGYLLWKHGAGLGRWARARGLVIDGVTYAGQAVIDHNLGAIRGRLEERRRHAGRPRPRPDHRRVRLPIVERGVIGALRARLGRRRAPRREPPA